MKKRKRNVIAASVLAVIVAISTAIISTSSNDNDKSIDVETTITAETTAPEKEPVIPETQIQAKASAKETVAPETKKIEVKKNKV